VGGGVMNSEATFDLKPLAKQESRGVDDMWVLTCEDSSGKTVQICLPREHMVALAKWILTRV
jgi:hypothetical protein